MKKRSFVQASLILSLAASAPLLAGCGLKGPLYMPRRKPRAEDYTIPLLYTPAEESEDDAGTAGESPAPELEKGDAGAVAEGLREDATRLDNRTEVEPPLEEPAYRDPFPSGRRTEPEYPTPAATGGEGATVAEPAARSETVPVPEPVAASLDAAGGEASPPLPARFGIGAGEDGTQNAGKNSLGNSTEGGVERRIYREHRFTP